MKFYYAQWQPNSPYALGVVGELIDGSFFVPRTTLQDMGITFDPSTNVVEDLDPSPMNMTSEKGGTITTSLKGEIARSCPPRSAMSAPPRPVIHITPYDPQWIVAFEAEAMRLKAILGPICVGVHHIGSTSIPGMVAKPIIDILLSVGSIESLDGVDADLVAEGYESWGAYGLPRRRLYVGNHLDGARRCHIHSYKAGDPEEMRHLAFREYLIAHPEEAQGYADLKQSLVKAHNGDKERYISGKSGWIKERERRALLWASAQGPGGA